MMLPSRSKVFVGCTGLVTTTGFFFAGTGALQVEEIEMILS
jgi:hypothetical protein